MLFLSNFNTLVGILLGPTDLLESIENITFCISVLSVGLTKKEILDLFQENLKNVYDKMKY